MSDRTEFDVYWSPKDTKMTLGQGLAAIMIGTLIVGLGVIGAKMLIDYMAGNGGD